jgi:hypothetical protein
MRYLFLILLLVGCKEKSLVWKGEPLKSESVILSSKEEIQRAETFEKALEIEWSKMQKDQFEKLADFEKRKDAVVGDVLEIWLGEKQDLEMSYDSEKEVFKIFEYRLGIYFELSVPINRGRKFLERYKTESMKFHFENIDKKLFLTKVEAGSYSAELNRTVKPNWEIALLEWAKKSGVSLPQTKRELMKMESLELRNRNLSEIPDEVQYLAGLQKINLGQNPNLDFENAIEILAQIPNLQILYLHSNKLTTLPNSIGNLKNLQTLYLGNNPSLNFDSVLKILVQIPNLQTFCLNSNQLTILPNSIKNLTNLQSLCLGENPNLNFASAFKILSQIPNLQTLDLSWNKRKELPNSIENLTNLQSLYLLDNQLTTLPNSIGNLKNLQTLSLGGNQLTTLPSSINSLSKLKSCCWKDRSENETPLQFMNRVLGLK